MAWLSDERLEQMNEDLGKLRTEVNELRALRQQAGLLVAGACRQGFVNDTQREALMYAFMGLSGETDYKLAQVLVHTNPKGYVGKVVEPKPLDYIPPFYVRETE